jgi:CRISPR/Cas system endoribonuclease Cas6 (RAMP superfamily)
MKKGESEMANPRFFAFGAIANRIQRESDTKTTRTSEKTKFENLRFSQFDSDSVVPESARIR